MSKNQMVVMVASGSMICSTRRSPGGSRAGATIKHVTERAGIASATTAFDRYGHLYPTEDRDLADRLDDVRGPLPLGVSGLLVRRHGSPRSARVGGPAVRRHRVSPARASPIQTLALASRSSFDRLTCSWRRTRACFFRVAASQAASSAQRASSTTSPSSGHWSHTVEHHPCGHEITQPKPRTLLSSLSSTHFQDARSAHRTSSNGSSALSSWGHIAFSSTSPSTVTPANLA